MKYLYSSHDSALSGSRSFLLAQDLLEDSNNLVVGAFYDAYDDGHLDVMAVQDYNNGTFRYTNLCYLTSSMFLNTHERLNSG